MGMPKKGSRVIDVDGRNFRWVLASSKIRERWDDPQPARHGGTLTVQEECDTPGHVLQHELSWLRGDSVTPEAVREIIRRALTAGWEPKSKKRPRLFGQKVIVDHIVTKLSLIKEMHDS
jgi:hypothetical protein